MTQEIVLNIKTISILLFIGAFLLTYAIIPKIIGVVEYKNLMDDPNGRSSHFKLTPTLGGVAFFATLIVAFFFIHRWDNNGYILDMLPGLTILFFVGLKDDLIILSPTSKLIAQILAASFLLSNEQMLITSLNGFLGFTELSSLIAYPISVFIIVMIINAYNLIDGIDGLAAIVGAVILALFSILYYYVGMYFFSMLGIVGIAMLLAYLRYNLSDDKKIFMGDTGSLLIGFLISVLTIKFLAMDQMDLAQLPFHLENIPLIVLAVLIVPLFDTARVFVVRLLNGKSPFKPDRNHIHHLFLDLGLSHKSTSLLMGLFNLIFAILFVILASSSKEITMMILMGLAFLILVSALFFINRKISSLRWKVRIRKSWYKIQGWFHSSSYNS